MTTLEPAVEQSVKTKEFITKAKAKHPNADYDYSKVVYINNHTKIIIICKICKISFEQIPNSHLNGHGCKMCGITRRAILRRTPKSFELSFASYTKSQFWHKTKNNGILPEHVCFSSSFKYWFTCDNCNHDFDKCISDITNKTSWCGYCNGNLLCNDEKCEKCFNKSFASQTMSQFWHKTKNNGILPRDICKYSDYKCWFICIDCNHSFNSTLSNITYNNNGCSYCNGSALCNDNDCKLCYEKSFASHEKSLFWHETKNNKILPRNICKGSDNKCWFTCDKCKHDFDLALSAITNINRQSWCRYCNSYTLCNNINCNLCFNKSFASHEKVQFWNDTKNNGILPRDISKSTHFKYWFTCDECNHDFSSILKNITNGSWCPYCINKTELKLFNHLRLTYPTITRQFIAQWCKNAKTNRHLPFDFVISEHKIIIELDGPQHFEQISNWDSPEKTCTNDKYKMKCANDNGFCVIRILQTDVLGDLYDWQTDLQNHIESLLDVAEPYNIFISKNGEYINHIEAEQTFEYVEDDDSSECDDVNVGQIDD